MKKRKWLKRALVVCAVLIAALIGLMIAANYMSGARPDWYRARAMDKQEIARLEEQARGKLLGLQNWAQDHNNWPHVESRPRVDTDPTTRPTKTRTIELTQDELNAILAQWEDELLAKYGDTISEPYIALQDGHIILAVTLKDANKVLSLHVEPKLDEEGKLLLSPDRLMAGMFPVPQSFWSGYMDKLVQKLSGGVEYAREQARLEADGTGNLAAITSGMNRLLLNSLKDVGSDPVLFLPPDLTKLEKGYPVKVVDVKVENETLALTFVTLSSEEQQQLLARLRAPYGEEPPPAITSKPQTADKEPAEEEKPTRTATVE